MIDRTTAEPDQTLDERYSAAWSSRGDSIPSLADFLDGHSDASPTERLEVVLSDQRLRWAGGNPRAIDDYLAAYPFLSHERESILKLVQGDFLARLEHGGPAEPASYERMFPDLADEVRRQCEVDKWLTLHSGLESACSLDLTVDHGRDATQESGRTDDRKGPAEGDQAPGRDQSAPLSEADFQRLRLLGSGGMGEVHEAFQKSLHKHVALKLIRREALDSESRVRRFFAEARALARLRHPHIVGVHGIGRMADGRYFLVMDLVEGGSTLSTLIKAGPIPCDRAAALVATVAEAIDHAHSRGVIHRDLKPSNVLLDLDGRPHVTDFGLAKIFDSTDPDHPHTTAETVLGTPHYMASEQADASRGPITPRTDVYGLGGLLYTLLTGKPPVQGDSLTTILTQVVSPEPVRSPRALRDDIPRGLERIALNCLEKNADDRYASAADVAKALRSWTANPDQEPIDTPAVSPQEKGPGGPGRSDQGWVPDRSWKGLDRRQHADGWGARARSASPSHSRRRLALVGTASAMVLALLIFAPMLLRKRGPLRSIAPSLAVRDGMAKRPHHPPGFDPEFLAQGPDSRPTPANIAVRSHQSIISRFGRGTGSIAIVLDCSGSMRFQDHDIGNRNEKFQHAKDALTRVLKEVPQGTSVSIWTFSQLPPEIVANADGVPQVDANDPQYSRLDADPEQTIQCLHKPSRWDPNQVDALRAQLDGLRPWFHTPLVAAMVRAANTDLINAKGMRTLLVLTDGNDDRFEQSRTLAPLRANKPDIPSFIASYFKTLRITINMVFLCNNEKDPELMAARADFAKPLERLDPPGTFVSATDDQLIPSLSRALRQKLVYEVVKPDGTAVGEPRDVTDALAEPDRWWPNGLDPGDYELRIHADQIYVQQIRLVPGERAVFQLVEKPDGGIGVARLLEDVRRPPPGMRGP